MNDSIDASQFYTGLVVDLYEPLVSERARAADYVPFLERAGTPALELACGSGVPLLDLVTLGYEVEGLDASADMLARCRATAAERNLSVTLHTARMQAFALPRRYRAGCPRASRGCACDRVVDQGRRAGQRAQTCALRGARGPILIGRQRGGPTR